MEILELIDEVVGENHQGRCKTTVGSFVEKKSDNESLVLVDEFYVEKPIVQLSEFADAENNEYYSVEFCYKSKRDEDLRQHWQFLERFARLVLNKKNSGTEDEELPLLSISLVPINLRGKYSIFIKDILPNSLIRVEYAEDNMCSIRAVSFKENVLFFKHDNELVEPQQIEAEVSREVENELDNEFSSSN